MNRRSKQILLLSIAAVAVVAPVWLLPAAQPKMPVPNPADVVGQRGTPALRESRVVPALTPLAHLVAAETRVQATADGDCAMPALSAASDADLDDSAAEAAFLHHRDIVAVEKGARRIGAALRKSTDPFANAVAVWLDLPQTDNDTQGIPPAERLHRLATMAASTDDPRLYALAFRTCIGSPEAACQALSVQRWAALDVGNAVPWLFMLSAAEASADISGQQDAWFHLASSTRFDDRLYTQLEPILSVAGDNPDEERAAAVLSVMGIGMASAQPVDLAVLSKGCRDPAVADANRFQLCTKVADLLFEHSDTDMPRLFGAAITKRMTGVGTRSEQVHKELQFWTANDLVAPRGCTELRSQLALMHSLATRGSHGTFAALTSSAASR
jgi:hypothetical protein